MEKYCPYCNNLLTAFEHNNYCSKTDQEAEGDSGNVFFINSNQLKSGKHTSRFTLRGVLNGYQYHKVGQSDCVVKSDNYLVVSKGQTYYTEIDSDQPIEAVIVAYGDNELNDVLANARKSSDHLLDEPVDEQTDELEMFETAYASDQDITNGLIALKAGIVSGTKTPLFFQEQNYQLLEKILANHFATLTDINKIKAAKKSTKIELYKRISRARDYMSAYLGEKLCIEKISSEAALSPYHFFRTFKEFYGQTPLEYLTSERLKYAAYLLKTTETPVSEITTKVGFESPSSFTRVFRRNYQMSPSQMRLS